MNFDKYQQAAFRTCKDKGSIEMNLLHMVIGIHSEYDELFTAIENKDKVNIGEEIADHFWYIAGFCSFKGWSLYGMMSDDVDHTLSLTRAHNILKELESNPIKYCIATDVNIEGKCIAYILYRERNKQVIF